MSFIENFKDATIGFSGYPRLARDRSNAFGFMALLLLISVSIACLITTVQTRRVMSQVAVQVEKGPDFALRDGEFVFDGQMPYEMDYGDLVKVIVDTTGQTDPESLQAEDSATILITRTAMYQVDPLGVIRSTSFRALPLDLTREDVVNLLTQVYRWVPAFYAVIYLLQLGFKALDAAILASIAVAYGSTLKRQVSMAFGFKLSLYAMSLPNLLQWVFPSLRTYTLGGLMLWWALSIMYLMQGLKACADAGILEPMHGRSNPS